MSRCLLPVLLGAALSVLAPTRPLLGQGLLPSSALSGPGPLTASRPLQEGWTPSRDAGRVSLYSALLPGAGQYLMGQKRWTAYLALEGWAWIQYVARRREGRDLQRQYRDLAWYVARRISSGPRVEGGFEYYEAMTQYRSSGAYDRDPQAPGVQPETDPGTFNGTMWALAREIYLPGDPSEPVSEDSEPYQGALRYYFKRAYGPEFAWTWGDNSLQQAKFAGLIRDSDENLRRSTTMVGIILGNHLLSAVDALISTRVHALGEGEAHLQLLPSSVAILPGGWELVLRIPPP